ncbi:MAG TPA: hypothetical protein DEA89_02030 [Candidatus Moranbacteria bacterium]|nr:hypothetical protein [Candidatus Moranbacteria bacterium]
MFWLKTVEIFVNSSSSSVVVFGSSYLGPSWITILINEKSFSADCKILLASKIFVFIKTSLGLY